MIHYTLNLHPKKWFNKIFLEINLKKLLFLKKKILNFYNFISNAFWYIALKLNFIFS